jgi:hypothetical protein
MSADPFEDAVAAAAVRALRRRAERQVQIARAETTTGERGAHIMTGEGRIALVLATTLAALADEIDARGRL